MLASWAGCDLVRRYVLNPAHDYFVRLTYIA